MTNKEIYKQYRRMTRKYNQELRYKARNGDNKAALEVMSAMIVDATIEKHLGWQMNDDGTRIVKRRPYVPDGANKEINKLYQEILSE